MHRFLPQLCHHNFHVIYAQFSLSLLVSIFSLQMFHLLATAVTASTRKWHSHEINTLNKFGHHFTVRLLWVAFSKWLSFVIVEFICEQFCNHPGLLAATLAILIKIIILDIVTMSTTLCWIVMSVLVVGLLAIVFVLGAQPRGNAMFTMSLSHPLIAATVLFACIYLFTAVDVTAWIRIVIWMTIGNLHTIILNALTRLSSQNALFLVFICFHLDSIANIFPSCYSFLLTSWSVKSEFYYDI